MRPNGEVEKAIEPSLVLKLVGLVVGESSFFNYCVWLLWLLLMASDLG